MSNIGVESWCYISLQNIGCLGTCGKTLRLQIEKAYIRKLNPKLNIRYKPTKEALPRVSCTYRRPLIKFRKMSIPPLPKNEIRFSTYKLSELAKQSMILSCVDEILNKFKHGHTYEIKILQKGYITTTWDFLLNNIGDSPVIPVKRAVKLSHFRTRLRTNKFKSITFICNKMQFVKNNISTTSRS